MACQCGTLARNWHFFLLTYKYFSKHYFWSISNETIQVINNWMPFHCWLIRKIWYLSSRKISQDNTQYNRKHKNEDSTFDLGFSLKLFHIWSRCPKLLLSLLIYKLFSEVRAWLALTSQQECLEKWVINNLSVWMFFFFLSFWLTRRVAIHFLRHRFSPVKQQRSTVQQLNQKTQKTSFFRPHLALGPSITHSQVILQHKPQLKIN